MRESQIEKKVVDYCRKHGIYTRKFTSPANRGVPDRIMLKNGKVLFLELKALGNRPTDLQEHELKVIREHGGNAHWADSYAAAIFHIDRTFNHDLI